MAERSNEQEPTLVARFEQVLTAPERTTDSLEALLSLVAELFTAKAAGVAQLVDQMILARKAPAGELLADAPTQWPWQQADVLEQVRKSPVAVAFPAQNKAALLASSTTPLGGAGWLLWLEGVPGQVWSPYQSEQLALLAQSWVRHAGASSSLWAQQLEKSYKQQRLEDNALFIRRLAHDFGNVLTGILGFNELARKQIPKESSLIRHLEDLHQAAQRGAHWVHQLRQFSRRQATRSAYSSLSAILAEEEPRLRRQFGNAGLRLAVPNDLPTVGLDADSLRQIVISLLNNAHESLPGEGLVSLTAQTVQLSADACLAYFGNPVPGPALELTVTDTGCGLSLEARRKIFVDPFFTTKPRQRGMGLSVAYGLLFAHNGGLRLESGPEKGTIARMVLPLAKVTEPLPTAPAATSVKPAAKAGQSLRGKKVLVVDDDKWILQVVCTTLERAAYRVQSANSAAEAITLYNAAKRDEPFSLVVTDVIMPQMTGIDLARCLLTQEQKLNMLFMSGIVTEDFTRHNIGGWYFDFVAKPFHPEGLLKAVRTAIEKGPRKAVTVTEVE